VKGNSLIVNDGDDTLSYQASAANKPKAIVMTGWSGLVSIEAIRFCHDNNITIVLLDWSRDFLSIVAPTASHSASLVRTQCASNPVNVAREIIRQKLAAYVNVKALPARQGGLYSHSADRAQTISSLLALEALAAVWRGRQFLLSNGVRASLLFRQLGSCLTAQEGDTRQDRRAMRHTLSTRC
jgi:CRISPR/Cas system-associated endonuclease Cas1